MIWFLNFIIKFIWFWFYNWLSNKMILNMWFNVIDLGFSFFTQSIWSSFVELIFFYNNWRQIFKKTQCIASKFPNCVVSITHMLIMIYKNCFIFNTLLIWIFNIRFLFEQIREKEFENPFITPYLNVSIMKKTMI